MSADYEVRGNVAIITLKNAPINGLGLATRAAAVRGVERALTDDAVEAIVITGAGKAFSGGADIKEFNSPKALTLPTLHTLISVVEASSKPVVAAIHSVCMGGGLELALGCNYRVAAPGAQIALPEVKLGLLPGAGGTQRLPRVVGLETALEMIVTGTPVLSEKLAGTSLFDLVIAPGADLLQAALAFAAQVAAVRPLPRVRERHVEHADLAAFIEQKRHSVGRLAGVFPAPLKCLETVAASATMAFEDGLKFERALFMQLIVSPESKALRHAFFAERVAGKVPDVPPGTPTRAIMCAAVVGAGTMGAGIAMCFANANLPVILLDTAQAALDKGMAVIRTSYESSLAKGKLSEEQCALRIGLITDTLAFADIAHADIVIEAVFEDMELKQTVFKQLDAVMKPGAILASNTSTLDLDQIAACTQRAQDVIGLHFFSPANVMKLLEIVRGAHTGKDVLASALALSKKLGKTGVVSGVCDGFIGNRMIEQYLRQGLVLLEEGCLPQQVDAALEQFGFAMGPFRMADLAGNDVGWLIRKRRATLAPAASHTKSADVLCEMGRYGQKAGAGWYDYPAGQRHAVPSPLVNQLLAEHSTAIGVARRTVDDGEIVARLVFALVNEGAKLLDEGIALRASDIDMVYLSGYGFPLHRGGPMFYADSVGLQKVLAALENFGQGRDGGAFAPAPLLIRLAAESKHFND